MVKRQSRIRLAVRAVQLAMLLLLALPMLLSCCSGGGTQGGTDGGDAPTVKGEIFAMDTYMTITCTGRRGSEALEAALDEIKRIDRLFSISSAEGEIHPINESGAGSVSADTVTVLNKALELYESTNGAFDITVYPIMELWGFTDGDFRVPSAEELSETLRHVGSERVKVSGDSVSIGDALGIDLGGIAKGYTSDMLMRIFAEYGLASGCVSLGGNVQCFGAKPDGSLWRCGIVHPQYPDLEKYLGIISVRDKAVITSGAYERFFIDDATGKRYHHIIDPKTGYPAESGLISVTIVSESGILADGLSTACYVMGLDGAVDYWRAHRSEFDMILMTEDGRVFVTEPISTGFSSDIEVKIID